MTQSFYQASETGHESLQRMGLSPYAVHDKSTVPSLKLLAQAHFNAVVGIKDTHAAQQYVDLHEQLRKPDTHPVLKTYWEAADPKVKMQISVNAPIAIHAAVRHEQLGNKTGKYMDAIDGYQAETKKALNQLSFANLE